MRKLVRRIVLCFLLASFFWCGALIRDRQLLRQELIRFHVVAASDSGEDQAVKLRVRDAVLDSMQQELRNIGDMAQAKAYLRENLPRIRDIANRVLTQAGFPPDAAVTLCPEAFDTRVYDTFALPAGIYESLRITIGEGEGKNWWCVVFPSLCLPAAGEDFRDAAAGAGFSEALNDTLTGETGYELRFFLLDLLGKTENILFREE